MTSEKPKKNAEISARVELLINDAGDTPNSFAKKLNYERSQTIYDIINGKSAPSYDFFNRFMHSEYSEIYEIAWLLTGGGQMNKSTVSKLLKDDHTNIGIALKAAHNKGIPLIPIDAVAGAMSDNNMQVMEHECEYYDVPLFKNADFLMQVTGDSMQPKYYSGDIVACRKVFIGTFFQWNRVYVVDTNQGVIIKRVHEGKDAEHLKLISENRSYKPIDISLNDIFSLALVIGVVRAE